MADFQTAHDFVAKWEGGLADHPSDPGGITNYGISLRFLQGEGIDIDGDGDVDADDIRGLTFEQAALLYRQYFWEPFRLSDFPQDIATCFYDCAVNCGPRRATRITQRACNSFVGPYGVKLIEDGIFGAKTRAFLLKNRHPKLVPAMLDQREAFYERLVQKKPSLNVFLNGWLRRCQDLRQTLRS